MKRLVVVRHAKAAKEIPRLADADRPLHERGERDAPEAGRLLARRRVLPDAVVASPARRARDTARLLAREIDFPWDRITLERRVYEADAADLLEVVRETPGAVETLLLVGHNPGLTDLVRDLVPGFAERLPTAAVVAVDLPVDTWGRVRRGGGSLAFFETARDER